VGARPLWASAEDGMKGDEIEPRAASSDSLGTNDLSACKHETPNPP
jgi:hypothetical protein